MYLDEVQIQLISVGGSVISLSAPKISEVSPSSDKITVTWETVEHASGYSVEYKKSSDADWTVAGTTDQLTFAITGLEPSTSYDVRVQATASGDNKSEYSEVKTVSTTEAPKSLAQKGTYVSSTQIGVEWSFTSFADFTADYEDTYTVAILWFMASPESANTRTLKTMICISISGFGAEKPLPRSVLHSSSPDSILQPITG